MKGKVILVGLIIALIMIIVKFSVYAVSTLSFNAILPIFQGMNVAIEYVLDIVFSLTGFLIFGITFIIKPQKIELKWKDEEGNIKSKSTNKYLIGVVVGILLIFFSPLTQLIMLFFYYTNSFYTILLVLGIIEGIGWMIAGYGLGSKVISRCFNCNKIIESGKEIKCKECKNKFCSDKCYQEHILYTHDKCAICGKGFGRGAKYETCPYPECKNLKFCSPNCLAEHQKLKHS
ncbi:MAG: hypothetical protein ACTSYZ_11925 [Candidatus Helarchaeota archaeon]